MNIFLLSIKNIVSKPLSAVLSILLFSFGVMVIVSILLTRDFLEEEIRQHVGGIDLVVGAKGSPLQIILCGIFHMDFPTGNISLKDAHQVSNNRYVSSAIPLSLGDSYAGYRIVGTTRSYPLHYGVGLRSGRWFDEGYSATIGSAVAEQRSLSLGDSFTSAHGLVEGGGAHDEHSFRVTGIMSPSGTVLDRLILVPLASIWSVHEHESSDASSLDASEDSHVSLAHWGIEVTQEQYEEASITQLLLFYRSPMAAVQLPRRVNQTSNLQAASPAYETARLFAILGVGIDLLNFLGMGIMLVSALSVFLSLIHALKERKYELAIMRAMGASRVKVFLLIIVEGVLLTFVGSLLGFIFSRVVFGVVVYVLGLSNFSLFFVSSSEWLILVSSLVLGIFASLFPAILAYRTSISFTLSKA